MYMFWLRHWYSKPQRIERVPADLFVCFVSRSWRAGLAIVAMEIAV